MSFLLQKFKNIMCLRSKWSKGKEVKTMTKKELLNLIETIKEEENIDELIKGTDLAKSMLSLDNFKGLVATDSNFKSFMDSEKDKYSSKALETWKGNNLNKLIDEEIKKRFPEKSEKDLELEKLKQEIEQMKTEKLREQLTNKALKIANEKKLPAEIVDFMLGNDEETTVKNIEKFESIFNDSLQNLVKEKVKDNSYTPPKSEGNTGDNPYSTSTFNLTKQMEIEMKNPEMAKQLKEQAKIQ